MACVYMATNKINGKRYIGATEKSIDVRMRQHINAARRGTKGCPRFYRAIRKYGSDAFDWDVLEEFESRDWAFSKEIDYIHLRSPEYVLSTGGEGAGGVKRTPEQRAAMSRAKKGKPASPAAKAAQLLSWTPERKARQSAVTKGRKKSPEEISRQITGYHKKEHGKPVMCLETGRVYGGALVAGRDLNIDGASITACANGLIWRAKGLHFIRCDVGIIMSESGRLDKINELETARHAARVAGKTDHLRKISSETMKQIHADPERRAAMYKKIRESRTGAKHSESTKTALSDLGKKPENLERFKQYSHLGSQALARPVRCIDDGLIYPSASAAARAYGAEKSAVIEVCLKKPYRYTAAKKHFEYVFEYVTEKDDAV